MRINEHCAISMSCYDAIREFDSDFTHDKARAIGKDAAGRFMNICFGVETNILATTTTEGKFNVTSETE